MEFAGLIGKLCERYPARGGTELIDFDEWKAMDDMSENVWVPKDKTDVLCEVISEIPEGWGLQSAAQNPTTDLNPTHDDDSLAINPGASGLAIATSSSAWNYNGIPSFYELSTSALAETDPRLKYAIRLKRDKSHTVTSEGRSAVSATPCLNNYHANPAGGAELVAVSAIEVVFRRPYIDSSCPGGGTMGRDNCYGRERGKANEIGSLFNPYWEVRLVQSQASLTEAQVLQGATLP